MTKAIVHFASCHSSGNVFAVLALVRDALRRQRRIEDFNKMRDRVFETKSYGEALGVMREYVVLIDDDGRY